jgi:hypothetical protein
MLRGLLRIMSFVTLNCVSALPLTATNIQANITPITFNPNSVVSIASMLGAKRSHRSIASVQAFLPMLIVARSPIGATLGMPSYKI